MQIETYLVAPSTHDHLHHTLRRVARQMLRRWQHRVRRARITVHLEHGKSRAHITLVDHQGKALRRCVHHRSPRAAVAEGLREMKHALGRAA